MEKTPEYLQELLQRLNDLAALVRAGFRWKTTGPLLLPEPELPRKVGYHDDVPFCAAVKCLAGGEQRCIWNDSREILARLNGQDGFVKHCHAGATELILPIAERNEKPPGVVLIGPFRLPGCRCPYATLQEHFRRLPILEEEMQNALLRLVPPLLLPAVRRAYLESAGLLPRFPTDPRLIDTMRQIRENPLCKPSSLAKKLFLSKSRFLHLFQQECGIGIGQYLQKLRLRMARQLLLHSQEPLSEIAGMTGFTDQSHLTAAFRREFGLPPAQYRKAALPPKQA